MYKSSVKVPINPNFIFCLNKSFYNSEQNGAKIFVFGRKRNFLRIFKAWFCLPHERVEGRLGLVM